MTHGAALCAALVIAALASTTRASAAPRGEGQGVVPGEAVLLVYEPRPPSGCPAAAEVEAEVAKLTSKARFAAERQRLEQDPEVAATARRALGERRVRERATPALHGPVRLLAELSRSQERTPPWQSSSPKQPLGTK